MNGGPEPVLVQVCRSCGQPWDKHITWARHAFVVDYIDRGGDDEPEPLWDALDGNERAPYFLLTHCIMLLREANRGPVGPPGMQGPMGPAGMS